MLHYPFVFNASLPKRKDNNVHHVPGLKAYSKSVLKTVFLLRYFQLSFEHSVEKTGKRYKVLSRIYIHPQLLKETFLL